MNFNVTHIKIKIAIFVIAVLTILIFLKWPFVKEWKYFGIDDLVRMYEEGFSEVFIKAKNQKLYLTKSEIDGLMKNIEKMELSVGEGLKGGKWYFHCTLNFRIPNDNRTYRIRFVSRTTMIGIQARTQVMSDSKLLQYSSYRGDNVVSYMDEIAFRKLGRVKGEGTRRSLCSPETMRDNYMDL